MAYGDFKGVSRRITYDKVLRDKVINIVENPKYNDEYQRALTSIVYKFINKKSWGDAVKNEIMSNQKLIEELHKPII